eukprot:340471_1
MPEVAAPVYAAPVQTYAAPVQTYAAPAPRGRKARVAAPVMAAPVYEAPAPIAAAPVAPVYEAPTTGAMPWETEVVGEAPVYAAPTPVVAAPVYAAPVQTYAAPAPVAPMAQPTFDNQAVTLPGKSLSFTGALETATRAEASAMAAQAGAVVHTAITPQTNFLVCGANPGQTKLIASQAAGVRNLTEGQFMKAAIPAVNAMPEVAAPVYAAPVQTYAAPAPRGRKARVAAPVMAAPVYEAPAAIAVAPVYEAPTGAMPWETEVVGEVAPVVAAPKVRAPRKVAAPVMQTYAAPAPVAPVAVAPVAQVGAITLAGQSVVFTGALQVNRVIAATMVTKAGGMPQPTLTAKTNLLVCGANAGPKMAKAQAMGVRCINEAEFVGACQF